MVSATSVIVYMDTRLAALATPPTLRDGCRPRHAHVAAFQFKQILRSPRLVNVKLDALLARLSSFIHTSSVPAALRLLKHLVRKHRVSCQNFNLSVWHHSSFLTTSQCIQEIAPFHARLPPGTRVLCTGELSFSLGETASYQQQKIHAGVLLPIFPQLMVRLKEGPSCATSSKMSAKIGSEHDLTSCHLYPKAVKSSAYISLS